MRERPVLNPTRNELVEVHTCPACQRTFPVSPEGTTLVCPHCESYVDDETSVFAFDTVPNAEPAPAKPVPVVLRLPESESALPNQPTRPQPAPAAGPGTTESLNDRPTSVEPSESAPPPPPGRRVLPSLGQRGPFAWQLVCTYASVMTLIALYLAWQLYVGGPRRDRLNLPDLAPPVQKDGRVTTLIYVPPKKRLPASHVLRLGESRQYGSVMLTPLRVTRGPLQFRYFDPEVVRERAPTGDVLQLHLRLENVSTDQVFTPLDRQLVFARQEDPRHPGEFKTNNFVRTEPARSDQSGSLYLYDLSPESDWVVINQNLDHELSPGQMVETFLPTTEEGAADLSGPLVWRLHFRKGYNPVSFRGVTTLVEVHFDSREIQSVALGDSVSRSGFPPSVWPSTRCAGFHPDFSSPNSSF